MPNTLAHLGVQGIATRAILRGADAKWLFLGVIIPDIPWILQRLLREFNAFCDPYDLRLYAIGLASLAACLLICAAIALLTARPALVFAVLSLNSLLGLLLDAFQTKWGNGVHLFAPLSWKLLNFGLFWPESLATYVLTGFGVAYFLWVWIRSPGKLIPLSLRSPRRIAFALALAASYLLLPLAFLDEAEAEDVHSIQTLRNTATRPGKMVMFDREAYVVRGEHEYIRSFAGEEIRVSGNLLGRSGSVSVRGRFLDDRTLLIHDLREHSANWREAASIVGLALLLAFWVHSLGRMRVLRRSGERRL